MIQLNFIKTLANSNTTNKPQPVSGRTLQLIIGALGILLPFVLIVGAKIFGDCEFVQNSISAYYHTVMHDFFIGTLCSVAVGLFAYYGYSALDNIVAFFPTSVGTPFTDCLTCIIDNRIIGDIHYVSAALLFLTFAIFSIFIFTKTKGVITPEKKFRNNIYKTCGYMILVSILLIALYSFCLKGNYPQLDNSRPVFWLEALSLLTFSISWLVKSGIILVDKI